MADETLDDSVAKLTESEKRINQLSAKTKEAEEARETERIAREAAEKKALEAERERDFFSGFADVVGTNPAAREFKDDIKSKVLSGYTLEDATYAVLGKAGKLGTTPVDTSSPAGGSSPTNPPSGDKKVGDMTVEEKRAILEKELVWQ